MRLHQEHGQVVRVNVPDSASKITASASWANGDSPLNRDGKLVQLKGMVGFEFELLIPVLRFGVLGRSGICLSIKLVQFGVSKQVKNLNVTSS